MSTHTVKNLRTGLTMQVKSTAYGDLKDGDEFVRWANWPVLLSDLPMGAREIGNFFRVAGWNNGHPFRIHVMRKTPTDSGWLKEIDMTDAEEVADFEKWCREASNPYGSFGLDVNGNSRYDQ